MEHFASTYIALINKNYPRKKVSNGNFENRSMRIYSAVEVVTSTIVLHSLHSVSYSGNLFLPHKYETHGIQKTSHPTKSEQGGEVDAKQEESPWLWWVVSLTKVPGYLKQPIEGLEILKANHLQFTACSHKLTKCSRNSCFSY